MVLFAGNPWLKQMNALYIRLIFILLLLVLFFVKPEFEGVTDPDLLVIYIVIFFIATFIHLFGEWDNKNWFRLDVIFLLGYSSFSMAHHVGYQ
jgi:hypothetical protein